MNLNTYMVKEPMRVSELAQIRAEARKSKRVGDKTVFERIFENECRKIGDGHAPNTMYIREGY